MNNEARTRTRRLDKGSTSSEGEYLNSPERKNKKGSCF